eukprot:scpid98668/ scgid28476/ Sushi, von Willebrand factor type A, EGF and pentraxin domain-containing protein 1; Polydom
MCNVSSFANGVVVQQSDGTYKVSCTSPGYSLTSGNSTVTCGDNGVWQATGSCVVDCGSIPAIPNGILLETTDRQAVPGRRVGYTVMLSCNPGYQLATPADGSITCRADGNWSLSSSTPCITTPATPSPCTGPLPDVVNGVVMPLNDMDNQTLVVQCSDGYRINSSIVNTMGSSSSSS